MKLSFCNTAIQNQTKMLQYDSIDYIVYRSGQNSKKTELYLQSTYRASEPVFEWSVRHELIDDTAKWTISWVAQQLHHVLVVTTVWNITTLQTCGSTNAQSNVKALLPLHFFSLSTFRTSNHIEPTRKNHRWKNCHFVGYHFYRILQKYFLRSFSL